MANIIIIDTDIMIKNLNLKGNELLVYAVIYGFSKDGQGCFYGSISYLAETLNVANNTIKSALKSLVEKNLITKKDIYKNNVKYCEYRVTLIGESKTAYPSQKLPRGKAKTDQGVVKNCLGGRAKIDHNNILDNKLDNIVDSIEDVATESQPTPDPKIESKEIRHKHGEYSHVMLTDKQYNSLVEKYGSNIIDDYIKKIDEWIQLKGKSPYKDFNLAIQNWLKKDNIQPIQVYNYDNNQDLGGWW